ncbi:MAG TPA: hypothetical protein VH500_09420 [Nitrososphaeraceae archaeon]
MSNITMMTDGKSLGFQVNDNKEEEVQKQKIQLWSNVYETEFALCLPIPNSTDVIKPEELLFLAKTDPNTRYTHIVAESYHVGDFKQGWSYTLRHLIERYKEALQYQPQEEYLEKNKPITYHTVYPSSSKGMVEEELEEAKGIQRNIDYPLRLVTCLKCHYCNLVFEDVNERKEHELEWHV